MYHQVKKSFLKLAVAHELDKTRNASPFEIEKQKQIFVIAQRQADIDTIYFDTTVVSMPHFYCKIGFVVVVVVVVVLAIVLVIVVCVFVNLCVCQILERDDF